MLPMQDINREKKFHSVRYNVVDRDEARILISYATTTWFGFMKVLCKNTAPKIKRQVASVSKKTPKPSDSNKNISLSGPTYPPKVKYVVKSDFNSPMVE